MKISPKGLAVVGGLVVVAAAVTLVDSKPSKKDEKIGQKAFQSAELINAKSLVVKSPTNEVKMSKKDDGSWQLADGFPVDANKITTLYKTLGEMKIQRQAAKSKKGFANLDISEDRFIEISNGKDTRRIFLGKNRDGGGQYLAFAGEGKAFLVDKSTAATADADTWELKTLMDIPEDQVKAVSFLVDGKTYTASREKKEDDLKLVGKTNKKVKDYHITSLKSVVKGLNFSARNDPSNELAKTALGKGKKAAVELFDGRRYQLTLGKIKHKETEKFFVSVAKISEGKDVSKEDLAKDALLKSISELSSFEVGSFVYGKFVKKGDDVFEKTVTQKKKADKKG